MLGGPPAEATRAQENEKNNPKVFKSPQEVVDALKQAAARKDMAAILRCVDDTEVELQAAGMTFSVAASGAEARRVAVNRNRARARRCT
jgi:hypothetical protein